MWMTAVSILILPKMMISLIFGEEANFCDGLYSRTLFLTVVYEKVFKYLLLLGAGNNSIPAWTVMV